MITVENYKSKKSDIDWSKLPKAISDNKSDVEEIMEFYHDDKDIKETVDLFLKGINDNLPKGKTASPDKTKTEPKHRTLPIKGDLFELKKDIRVFFPNRDAYHTVSAGHKIEYRRESEDGDFVFIHGNDTIVIHKNSFYSYLETGEIKKVTPAAKKVQNTPKKETLQDAILKASLFRSLTPKMQQMAVMEMDESEEVDYFIETVKRINEVFEKASKRQDNDTIKDAIVYAHYFYGNSDWYITEYDYNEDMFFGYVILNGDTQMSEAGYISVPELLSIKGMELDFHFEQEKLGKVLHKAYPGEFEEYNQKPEKKRNPERSKIANLSEWKKWLKDNIGKVLYFEAMYENGRKLHETREISIVQTNSFAAKKPNGELAWMEFGKAADWTFSNRGVLFRDTNVTLLWYFEKPTDFGTNNQETKPTKAPAKEKVEKVVNIKTVEGQSNEFVLIRRFWNMIEKKDVVVPFRKVQLLYQAFNKAAVERKVRKASEDAVLFDKVKAKVTVLFEKFAEPTKANVEIEFTDSALYNEIKEYAEVKLNPAIAVLKRFIGFQGTKPDVKKAATLLKAITSTIDKHGKGNRLLTELEAAQKELKAYITKPTDKIEATVYGLSVPRSECTNRVKCAGLTHEGKLRKGYKFQEDTGHVIRVSKGKGVKKKNRKKKVAVGLGYSENNEPQEVIYLDNPKAVTPVIINMPAVKESEPTVYNNVDYSEFNPTGNNSLPVKKTPIAQEAKVIHEISPKHKSLSYLMNNDEVNVLYDIPGDVGRFLGDVEIKPKESVVITLSSPQGGGKTRGILQFANAFAHNYKVKMFSLEEHVESKLFKDKIAEYIDPENYDRISVESDLPKGIDTIHESIKDFDVILIDSWSKMLEIDRNINLDQDFRKKYDGKLFVFIFQQTSDGKMYGGAKNQFDGDIILFVEKFPDYRLSYIYPNKNRYTSTPLDQLKYNVYSQSLMKTEDDYTEVTEKIEL